MSSDSSTSNNRRQFLKSTALVGGGFLVSGVAGRLGYQGGVAQASSPADWAELKEGENAPFAQYCKDAHNPGTACPDRAKEERKGQYCTNCMFYNKVKGEGKEELGTCALAMGIQRLVRGPGWCLSWVKKA